MRHPILMSKTKGLTHLLNNRESLLLRHPTLLEKITQRPQRLLRMLSDHIGHIFFKAIVQQRHYTRILDGRNGARLLKELIALSLANNIDTFPYSEVELLLTIRPSSEIQLTGSPRGRKG